MAPGMCSDGNRNVKSGKNCSEFWVSHLYFYCLDIIFAHPVWIINHINIFYFGHLNLVRNKCMSVFSYIALSGASKQAHDIHIDNLSWDKILWLVIMGNRNLLCMNIRPFCRLCSWEIHTTKNTRFASLDIKVLQ